MLKHTLLALLVSSSLAGCGDFCRSYKENFVPACVKACTEKAGADKATVCEEKCEEALPQDPTYKAMCSSSQ